MTTSALSDRVPRVPRGVKLRFDPTREQWFLLGPERVFEPDEIAVEILKRIDGNASLSAIAADLGREFGAPADEIGRDVEEFVQTLVGIRMLELTEAPG